MKRALVTGGSGGIGAAVSRMLARRGFHVIVHANHNPDKARRLAGDICESGGSAEMVAFDVTDSDGCERTLTQLAEAAAIQVVVNNAGIHADAPLAGMTPLQWRSVVDVTLNGFYNVTRPLLMPMMRSRWGRVISISSVAGVLGNRGQSNYAAAKSGLHGATKSLAAELATRGITVNAVAPGFIAAGMASEIPANVIEPIVPMKRAGSAEEVAEVIAFLASNEASYVTGQVIGMDGGMT